MVIPCGRKMPKRRQVEPGRGDVAVSGGSRAYRGDDEEIRLIADDGKVGGVGE